MESENKQNLLVTIQNILESYYNYLTGVIELAKLEAKLAINSLIMIAIFGVLILILVLTCWGWLQVILLSAFLKLNLGLLSASCIVGAIDLTGIFVFVFWIKKLKTNLYFTATRRQIVAPLKARHSEHEQSEISNNAS